jgi:hypothetical protein
MSTDLYAVYDEQTGTILHVHATPAGTEPSPGDILATLGIGHDRLRVLRLPAEGLTRPARVVDGQLVDAPEDVAFAGAQVRLTEQAPPQTARPRRRTFQRNAHT